MADGVENLGQVYHDCASDLAVIKGRLPVIHTLQQHILCTMVRSEARLAVFKSLLDFRNSTSWLATRDSKTLASTGRMEIGLRLLRSFLPPGLGMGLMFTSFHSDGN